MKESDIEKYEELELSRVPGKRKRPKEKRLAHKHLRRLEREIQRTFDRQLYLAENLSKGVIEVYRSRQNQKDPSHDFFIFEFNIGTPADYVLFKLYSIDTAGRE